MGDPSGKKPRRKGGARGDQKRPEGGGSSVGDCEGDRLVMIELDAAYALAEFAQLAHKGEEGCLLQQWGRKGMRSCKASSRGQGLSPELAHDVKEECHPVAEAPVSPPASQEVARYQACTADKEPDHKPPNTDHSVQLKCVKFEPIHDRPNLEPKISKIEPCQHGNKLRQPLTEIEKEARRVRRVQANRESARQTIRRKQALRDELSQKAAELAHENETMKQQTELVMQEYNSLKDRNRQLKEQISSRDEACESQGGSEVSQAQTLKVESAQVPTLRHNEMPSPPFLWTAPLIQASSATQAFASDNREAVTPMENNPFLTAYRNMAFNFWTNHSGNSHWNVPLFFLPYMTAFSLNVPPSSPHRTEHHSITTVTSTSSACHSRPSSNVRTDEDNSLVESKAVQMDRSGDLDTSSQTKMLKESCIDRPLQRSDFEPHAYLFGRASSHSPITNSSNFKTFSNREEIVQGGLLCDKAALNDRGLKHWGSQSKESSNPQRFAASHKMGGNFPTWVQEDSFYSGKSLSGAAAASEARKRRKELTRNKNIQARQLKLHC